jgi:hypothetical protein
MTSARLHQIAYTPFALLCGLIMLAPAWAAGGDVHALHPGVLIDADAELVWVADPRGRVSALSLDDGSALWQGPAEGLPLALWGGELLVLARSEGRGSMNLLALDPLSGQQLSSYAVDLPEAVAASIDAQPNRQFDAWAMVVNDTLQIHWQYAQWSLRGALLIDADEARVDLSGVIALDATERQATVLQGLSARRPRPDLDASERLPDIAATQFRSADRRHVQHAVPADASAPGQQWRWYLHGSDGRQIGTMLAPYSTAPFVLHQGRVLWRSEPLALARAEGAIDAWGPRLVAQDLGKDAPRWIFELFDPLFRGPLPP